RVLFRSVAARHEILRNVLARATQPCRRCRRNFNLWTRRVIDRMRLAPIALFIYKRPVHLRATFKSLAACDEASHSALHIFADAPKLAEHAEAVAEARAVAR